MFVVTITIEEYPNQRITMADLGDSPSQVWSSRTAWSHDNHGYRQGAADVLERAVARAAEALPPKLDERVVQ